MKKAAFTCCSIFIFALLCNGCLVAESKYLKKVEENEQISRKAASLSEENQDLQGKIRALTGKMQDLSDYINSLEAENNTLKDNLAKITKTTKEAQKEAEKASIAYQQLLTEMKSEIAKGEVTIRELEGKLTMDVVDNILFDSGEVKVKKEGLHVLDRVVEILKHVKDRDIRVEGHTDNVPITSKLARKYPTNWELSAARALNVAKYLQEQGIDPIILSATAFGEYQPIATNDTATGRAKNRRIAIILLPQD